MSYIPTNLVKCLYNLSVHEHDVCPTCQEFKAIVMHNCSAMLCALGEYQESSISKPALPTPDLSRLQIPPKKPVKKAHGFMFIREPLVDNEG